MNHFRLFALFPVTRISKICSSIPIVVMPLKWCLENSPEGNCPSVRVWFRISVRIRPGRQFSSGSIFQEPFEVTIIVCYLMHVSASRMLLQETFLVLKIIGMTHNDNQELSMHFQHPDA